LDHTKMTWQDTTITVSIIFLSYALIPQIMKGFRDKKGYVEIQTSLITSLSLIVVAFAFFTLGLYFSAIMDVVIASLWGILFLQKLYYR